MVIFMIRLRRNSSERSHRCLFYVLVKNYIFSPDGANDQTCTEY